MSRTLGSRTESQITQAIGSLEDILPENKYFFDPIDFQRLTRPKSGDWLRLSFGKSYYCSPDCIASTTRGGKAIVISCGMGAVVRLSTDVAQLRYNRTSRHLLIHLPKDSIFQNPFCGSCPHFVSIAKHFISYR